MQRNNLWAPWRMEYIKGLNSEHECFLCHNLQHPARDGDNYVLWRTANCLVVMNRFPYNNGHLLIAPNQHVGDMADLNDDELLEINKLVVQTQQLLTQAISPGGFNIGINIGRCAGAGLPGHLHIHVVPRWEGDTNYMAVCGQTDVVSQSLSQLYSDLKEIGDRQNLPRV